MWFKLNTSYTALCDAVVDAVEETGRDVVEETFV